MEEQFVSYNLALKLKELGFKDKSLGFSYMRFKCKGASNAYVEKVVPNYLYNGWDLLCIAPLWQQAFDWFNKNYGYFVSYDFDHGDGTKNSRGYWYCIIHTEDEDFWYDMNDDNISYYKTPEDVREASLEKLIELCQKIK